MSHAKVAAVLRGGPDGGAIPIGAHPESKVAETRMRLLLFCYAEHANTDGIAWLTKATLTKETGVPASQVSVGRKELVRQGLLHRIGEGEAKGGRVDRYHVLPGHADASNRATTGTVADPSNRRSTDVQPSQHRDGNRRSTGTGTPQNRQNGSGGEADASVGVPPPATPAIDKALTRATKRIGRTVEPTSSVLAAFASRPAWNPDDLVRAALRRRLPDDIVDPAAFLTSRIQATPVTPPSPKPTTPPRPKPAKSRQAKTGTNRPRRVDLSQLVPGDHDVIAQIAHDLATLPADAAEQIRLEYVERRDYPTLSSGNATRAQVADVRFAVDAALASVSAATAPEPAPA